MSELHCSHCGQKLSAIDKECAHCGKKISFWRDVKASIEHNRWYQALLAVFVVFLLGCSWYVRANTGLRWPLFATVIACAPLVPWLLQLAYKNAAPNSIPEDTLETFDTPNTEKASSASDSRVKTTTTSSTIKTGE